MEYPPVKLPKQLRLPFMQELEAKKRVHLSKQEHSELIQALAELIMVCARTQEPHKTREVQDEH